MVLVSGCPVLVSFGSSIRRIEIGVVLQELLDLVHSYLCIV
jgi:hypothetical protein